MLRARLALPAVVAAAAILAPACKDEKGALAGGADEGDLVLRRVPDSELVLNLPRGWLVEMPDPGPPPPVPADGSPLALSGRLLLEAKPGSLAEGTLIPPVIHVFEDSWLPVGTTGVDYLVAQRAANQKAIGANIRHVDAEPSRKDGRPTYHVRDEWTVLGPGGQSRDVSQEALLILETVKTPEGKDILRGYTVVITLEKREFRTLQPMVRRILDTVRFQGRG